MSIGKHSFWLGLATACTLLWPSALPAAAGTKSEAPLQNYLASTVPDGYTATLADEMPWKSRSSDLFVAYFSGSPAWFSPSVACQCPTEYISSAVIYESRPIAPEDEHNRLQLQKKSTGTHAGAPFFAIPGYAAMVRNGRWFGVLSDTSASAETMAGYLKSMRFSTQSQREFNVTKTPSGTQLRYKGFIDRLRPSTKQFGTDFQGPGAKRVWFESYRTDPLYLEIGYSLEGLRQTPEQRPVGRLVNGKNAVLIVHRLMWMEGNQALVIGDDEGTEPTHDLKPVFARGMQPVSAATWARFMARPQTGNPFLQVDGNDVATKVTIAVGNVVSTPWALSELPPTEGLACYLFEFTAGRSKLCVPALANRQVVSQMRYFGRPLLFGLTDFNALRVQWFDVNANVLTFATTATGQTQMRAFVFELPANQPMNEAGRAPIAG